MSLKFSTYLVLDTLIPFCKPYSKASPKAFSFYFSLRGLEPLLVKLTVFSKLLGEKGQSGAEFTVCQLPGCVCLYPHAVLKDNALLALESEPTNGPRHRKPAFSWFLPELPVTYLWWPQLCCFISFLHLFYCQCLLFWFSCHEVQWRRQRYCLFTLSYEGVLYLHKLCSGIAGCMLEAPHFFSCTGVIMHLFTPFYESPGFKLSMSQTSFLSLTDTK